VWVVTRGARAVRTGDPVDLAQAAVWGLLRAAELEHPELVCRRIDLDPSPAENDVEQMLGTLNASVDLELACRHGGRLAARVAAAEPQAGIASGAWRLKNERPGTLDGLTRRPIDRRKPAANEIEIEVRAIGLNFRDVLSALDMYPGSAGLLGSECAGVVSRIGAGVTQLSIGDEVMAFARGTFSSHVLVPVSHAIRRPSSASVAEAATMPVAFLTAMFGLERLAKLQRGERVLIHAATGGVGMAAVYVAQRLGAEVFATAGSDAKRERLRQLGVHQVFDSRSVTFASEIRERTGGAGVHVVLNALAGEFIAASVAALAQGGRFLEMGKRAIWSIERMHAERPDVRYVPFDLGEAGDADPSLVPSLFAALVERLRDGSLRPLPVAAFPIERASDAFRTMAQARHIGKIALTAPPRPFAIDSTASYLVTGGYGALGLRAAQWLAARGARHVVLTGRRAPSVDAAAAIEALRANGVQLITAQTDVSDGAALATLIAGLGAPLRGVIHAAGVLDDGVLLDQTWDRVRRVMAPKVNGAYHLHRLTRHLDLDFFVLFSAGAAWLGSPGQAGYCAANLSLDAFADARRSIGLPATSIAWGTWAEAGMAASLSQRDAARWRERGVSPLATAEALLAMEVAIAGADASVAALAVNWNRLVAAGGAGSRFERLASPIVVTSGPTQTAAGALAQTVRAAAPLARRHVMLTGLSALCCATLQLDSGTALDERRPLRDLGLDSLMAVELRNALVQSFATSLPATLLFDYPTLDKLAGYLLKVLALDQAVVIETPREVPALAGLHEIAALSDEEAEAQLIAELERSVRGTTHG
jgi:NADPH:quinone reductase-like Zn-dependent oxidoreductase/acyl carrier protein